MGQLVLVRLDERLIHGAVVTTNAPAVNAQKIVAVDDATANDEFMSMIMKAGAKGVVAEIYTLEQAIENYKKDQFGEGRILLLFKRVSDAYKAFNAGIKFEAFNLGWTNPSANKVKIDNKMSLTKDEVEMLKELEAQNVDVYLRYTPDLAPVALDKAISGKF